MSNDIKAGDLVMVVRGAPCCGSVDDLGDTAHVMEIDLEAWGPCQGCGTVIHSPMALLRDCRGGWQPIVRLRKIDPPAEGDSLPTRTNLDQPVELA